MGKTALRHTSAEFIAFLADVVATQPAGKQIHVIADNLSAHKTKARLLKSHRSGQRMPISRSKLLLVQRNA